MAQNHRGGSRLHTLAKNGAFEKLLEEAKKSPGELKSKNQFLQTPVHYAIRFGAPTDIVLSLVDLQPSVLTVRNNDGDLPIHNGCEFGMSVATLLAFLKLAPSTIDFVNKENRTPLEIAKNANVFMLGCSWHFYRDDYKRVVAALENPSVREALWEAQKATNFAQVPSTQPLRGVWYRDEEAEQQRAERLKNYMKNLDKPQVYIGIPADPNVRANLRAIQQLYNEDR